MPFLEIILREVPEGFEFLGVSLTIFGSFAILILLSKWWER